MKRVGLIIAFVALFSLGIFVFPREVFADPHAIFFTDRGQEQLFFNVLAALNQADYVEPPDRPSINADQRFGSFIRFGTYTEPTNQPQYTITRDPITGRLTVTGTPLEPNETTGVELPRIRVRQVTSDDGDVYYRQRAAERALAEAQRASLTNLLCGFRRLYLGEEGARDCNAEEDAI